MNGSSGEGAGQHDLVDCAVGASMLCRHQFGSDREGRRDGKAHADAGDQADDDQLLGGLRERDQQREQCADDDADLHDEFAAEAVGQQPRRCSHR